MTERLSKGAAVAAVAALAAATSGCGSDGTDPKSVEKKAQTLVQQTLEAVRPAIGSAATSVKESRWKKCSTETPGVNRFIYDYTLKVDVPKDRSQPVMDATKAHFTKSGYTPDLPDPGTARVGAKLPKTNWWVGVGVQDDASMFISVDSGCVSTSSDPHV
jgi:hypothetical protein